MVIARACAFLVAGVVSIGVAGCETDGRSLIGSLSGPEFTAPTPTVQESGNVKYYLSDEPLKLGLEHFDRGNYGVAERYFRDAVEKAPRDVTAWVALAATYDRISRFDLADRAFRRRSGHRRTTQSPRVRVFDMPRGDLECAQEISRLRA
jgi:hypothetical protein